MHDHTTAYATAPDLYEEHQELVRTLTQLPLRERLVRRAALADRSPLGVLRAYIRQEYAAWRSPAERRPTVYPVTRSEDLGATPCEDSTTARAHAEARYREDEHPDDLPTAE